MGGWWWWGGGGPRRGMEKKNLVTGVRGRHAPRLDLFGNTVPPPSFSFWKDTCLPQEKQKAGGRDEYHSHEERKPDGGSPPPQKVQRNAEKAKVGRSIQPARPLGGCEKVSRIGVLLCGKKCCAINGSGRGAPDCVWACRVGRRGGVRTLFSTLLLSFWPPRQPREVAGPMLGHSCFFVVVAGCVAVFVC